MIYTLHPGKLKKGTWLTTLGSDPNVVVCYPETDRPENIEAARKAYFSLQEDDSNWTWNVSWWSDPVLLGHYPEEGLECYEKYLPKITEEDMRLISEPIDIYGQNIYNGRCIHMGEDGKPQEVCRYEEFPKTAIHILMDDAEGSESPFEGNSFMTS